MFLICFEYGLTKGIVFFWGFRWVGSKKNKKQPSDRFLVDFPKVVWHDFDRVGFDTILI